MKWWWLGFSLWHVVHSYHQFPNILLIGSKQETYPMAKHYSRFYNIPLIETGYFYPKHFIMISEEFLSFEQETFSIQFKDYPHKGKHPNYFISWLKQTVL